MFSLDLGNLLVHLGADVRQFNQAMDAAYIKVNQASAKLGALGSKLVWRLTLPIVGIGAAMTKTSISLETAFAGVRKTVDATEKEFGYLRSQFDDLAKRIPISVSAFYELGEAAGQLGIQKQNIVGFVETMAHLSATTDMTGKSAAMMLARFANITQMPQTQFDRLGSVIVDLGNNLATTESEIVNMGLRLAGVGNIVGMTQAQIMSLAAALSSVGLGAEIGGSAVTRVMLDMYSAANKTGDELKKFATIAGRSVESFRVKVKTQAAQALIDFIEGLMKVKEGTGDAAAMMELFGENAGDVSSILEELNLNNIRVTRTLLSAAGAGDLFRKSLDRGSIAWEENVAMIIEAQKRYETVASRLRVIWNEVTLAMNEYGVILKEAVANTLEKYIIPMIRWFRSLDDQMKAQVLRYALVLAALGPVLLITSKLIMSLSFLSYGFLKAAGAGLALAAALGSISWIAAVVALGLIALAAKAYIMRALWLQNFRHIQEAVELLRDTIVKVWTIVEPPIKSFVKWMTNLFVDALRFINDTFLTGIAGVMGIVAAFAATVKEMGKAMIDAAGDPNMWFGGPAAMFTFTKHMATGFYNAGTESGSAFVEAVRKTLPKLKGFEADVVEGAKEMADLSAKALAAGVGKAIDALGDFVREGATAVVAQAKKDIAALVDTIKNKLKTMSTEEIIPADVFAEYEKRLDNINKNISKLIEGHENLALKGKYAWTNLKDYIEACTDSLERMADIATRTFDNLADTLTDFIMTGKADWKGFVQALLRDWVNMIIKMNMAKMAQKTQNFWVSIGKGMANLFSGGAATQPTAGESAATAADVAALQTGMMGAKGLVFDKIGGAVDVVRMALGGVLDHVGTGLQIMKLAAGGIVYSPTGVPLTKSRMALIGEAGPEAVMPLARTSAGELGVRSMREEAPTKVTVQNRIKVVNVLTMEEQLIAMQSEEGEQIFMNFLQRNGVI